MFEGASNEWCKVICNTSPISLIHLTSKKPMIDSLKKNTLLFKMKSLRCNIQKICQEYSHDSPAAPPVASSTATHIQRNGEEDTNGGTVSSDNDNAKVRPNINPHTVLSLDPNQLASILQISLEQVTDLRREVAHAIANDPSNAVGYSNSSQHFASTCAGTIGVRSSVVKSTSFIAGGTTLLDEFKSECEYKNSISVQEYDGAAISTMPISASASATTSFTSMSTGSNALDKLMSNHNSFTGSRKRPRPTQQLTSNYIGNNESIFSHQSVGLQLSKITQISAPSGCGKTQLALSIIANALASFSTPFLVERSISDKSQSEVRSQNQMNIHYIASGGGSSGLVPAARRLRQILGHLLSKQETQQQQSVGAGSDAGDNPQHPGGIQSSAKLQRDDLLNCVKFDYASDAYALLALLQEFEHELLHKTKNGTDLIDADLDAKAGHSLLVIDSISACITSLLYGEGDGGVGAALLSEIHLILKRISRSRGAGGEQVVVFVTNGMVSDNQNEQGLRDFGVNQRGDGVRRKPALGSMWRAPDFHIVLESVGDFHDIVGALSSRRKLDGLKTFTTKRIAACFERNSDGHCRKGTCEFGINSTGVVDL